MSSSATGVDRARFTYGLTGGRIRIANIDPVGDVFDRGCVLPGGVKREHIVCVYRVVWQTHSIDASIVGGPQILDAVAAMVAN